MTATDKIAAARALIKPLTVPPLYEGSGEESDLPEIAAASLSDLADLADAQAQEIAKQAGRIEALEAALKRCLNYLENTEGEFRITLDSADAARAALGETP